MPMSLDSASDMIPRKAARMPTAAIPRTCPRGPAHQPSRKPQGNRPSDPVFTRLQTVPNLVDDSRGVRLNQGPVEPSLASNCDTMW